VMILKRVYIVLRKNVPTILRGNDLLERTVS